LYWLPHLISHVRLRRDAAIAEKRQAEAAANPPARVDLPVEACREYASSVMAGETTAEDFGERLFWAAAEVRHRLEAAYPLPPRPAHLARADLDDRLLLIVMADPHPYWLLLPDILVTPRSRPTLDEETAPMDFVEPEVW
jgi:hypothetical protein